MSAVPTTLHLQPIDDGARDGRPQLVFGGGDFALGYWRRDAWVFGNGNPLPFEPDQYRPRANPELVL